MNNLHSLVTLWSQIVHRIQAEKQKSTVGRNTVETVVLPALDVLLQCHHHSEMLLNIRLPGRFVLSPQRIVHQLEVALPRQNVGVAVVEAQRDLGPSVGAAIAANYSDLPDTEQSHWLRQNEKLTSASSTSPRGTDLHEPAHRRR